MKVTTVRGSAELFGCCCLSSGLKPVWWMVVAHFGTLALPGPSAPVNITPVEIVLHGPCRKRPAGIQTGIGFKAESLSILRNLRLTNSFLFSKHCPFLSLHWLLSSQGWLQHHGVNFISSTENYELTFDGCTMTFVDGCAMFMVCILLLCSSTVSPAQEMWQTVAYWKLIIIYV